jgi:hypothetical protein
MLLAKLADLLSRFTSLVFHFASCPTPFSTMLPCSVGKSSRRAFEARISIPARCCHLLVAAAN